MSGGKNQNGSSGTPEPSCAPGTPPPTIKDSLKKPLPRRFYKEVGIGDGPPFQILLDGRPVKTPKKRSLQLPTRALAEAVADEWRAQSETIDPARMPLTRFANTAIDAVEDTREAVAADIAAYAGRDLLCYRAESPDELKRRQSQHWDPDVAWAEKAYGGPFKVVPGVMPV
jgi:chaperone required for assembly of F1-ATPase